MEDFYVIARQSKDEGPRSSSGLTMKAVRDGKMPGYDEMARARGAVLRERENSIFSDAWMPLALLMLVVGLVAGRYAPRERPSWQCSPQRWTDSRYLSFRHP